MGIVGYFGCVENEVMRDESLPLAAKGLYALLASYAGAETYCFPSRDTLIRESGITKTSFYKYLQMLIDKGYIAKGRFYPSGDGKFKNCTYYFLLRE